jgi:curved DNA-binding protein CbpA
MNLYEILNIKSSASEIEIKKAYHKLALLYHPDKNNSDEAKDKYEKIQYAYHILSNSKSRNDYCKLNNCEQSKFVDLLQKIFKNNLAIDELNSLGINFSINDWTYLENNFTNIINSLNLNEILDLFRLGKVPKKDFDTLSETNNSEMDDTIHEYYFNLPLTYQRINNLDIRINLDIKINDIIEETKRKIKIKRNINNNQVTNTFIFDVNKPYIVFPLSGDCQGDNHGHLIIKLNLPNNHYWQEGDNNTHLILIEQSMTLYEMIYGIDINMCLDNNNINIPKWLPSRDGLFIEINQLQKKLIRIAIKLVLNYSHTSDKEKILFEYFN